MFFYFQKYMKIFVSFQFFVPSILRAINIDTKKVLSQNFEVNSTKQLRVKEY